MQIHPKTHVFYKIRIPAPFMRTPRQPEKAWYPGKPAMVNLNLPKDATTMISRKTGFQVAEVEALWEQFKCLAGSEWPDDPCKYRLAIDRQTFDKCFVPHTSQRPPPPNLIYDRMFAFYDQDGNGLIGFQEFIQGLSCLMRNKADERQKKMFKAYDINNDGCVDRRDFLQMFKAYYALTKELTRDVIAGMEDDVSDSGARDIILGGQPLSSAFTGAIPRGERSRGSEGKYWDNFGDLIMMDDATILDEDFHHAADGTIFARTVRDVAAEMVSFLIDIHGIYSEPWPPTLVYIKEAQEVFGESVYPQFVQNPEDRSKILRHLHSVFAERYLKKHKDLRRILRQEQSKRLFTLDDLNGFPLADSSWFNNVNGAVVLQSDSKHCKDLEKIEKSGFGDAFYRCLKDRINQTDWPICDSWKILAQHIVELIMSDFTAKSIAQGLSGYSIRSVHSPEIFMHSVFEDLEKIAGQAESEKTSEEFDANNHASRRSRSSSKVRFQDDIDIDVEEHQESRSRATSISSRSIPINERWGGVEAPEPESDFGREVLYQAVQEGLNELLDPIFKLREDLAFAALRTRAKRRRFRAEIAAQVQDPIDLVVALRLFQQRWLRGHSFKISLPDHHVEGDESGPLEQFIKEWSNKSSYAPSVIEGCYTCTTRGNHIRLGGRCRRCGQNSSFAAKYLQGGRHTPKERCPRCKEESTIGGSGNDDSLFCTKCRHSSEFLKAEQARLMRIISGGESIEKSTLTNTSEATIETPNPEAKTKNDDTPINSATDLAESVAAFETADPTSLEERIAQKPLDDLLADSGYSIATTPETPSPLSPSDPTLPQNKPNTLIPQIPYGPPAQALHNEPPADPILPQHRSNGPSQLPHTQPPALSSSPEPMLDVEVLPSADTLRYYAALALLEYEDKERGGPGRLIYEEFEEIMEWAKGESLGFLGTWMETASF